MLSYDQIYEAVRNASEDPKTALAALLCNYLEDIGVGIYRPVLKDDRKALDFLMAQMLGLPAWAGMPSEDVAHGGPRLIREPRTIAVLSSNLLAPRCDGHFCS
jgi:hypothetical protein